MRFEPAIDKPALVETIRQSYGCPVTSLAFFPEGTVGCHYVAGCQDGSRYFVTLLTGGIMASLQASRLAFVLKLRSTLVEQSLFTAQPAVCRTLDGCLQADFMGMPLIVCDHIEGKNLWDEWPPGPALGAELGRLVATLHNTTSRLPLDIPYREEFLLPFEPDLHRSLVELQAGSLLKRPTQHALRDLVLPIRDRLYEMLAHLRELGLNARSLDPPRVLVHTDMHGGNLIRDGQGHLFVVDWEGAMLAPAEHDLFIFMGPGLEAMLSAYFDTAPSASLSPDLFAYYFYRRNLEDITYFLVPILHENTTEEQDLEALGYLRQDCLDGWSGIEVSIHEVRERLRFFQVNHEKSPARFRRQGGSR